MDLSNTKSSKFQIYKPELLPLSIINQKDVNIQLSLKEKKTQLGFSNEKQKSKKLLFVNEEVVPTHVYEPKYVIQNGEAVMENLL